MEIAKGIHRIPCVFDGDRYVFLHLLVGTQAVMLVDTGMTYTPEKEILPYMASIGVQPEDLMYLLITHSDYDHQGGAKEMRAIAPQAVMMCHTLDRLWVENTEALIQGRLLQFDEPHGFKTPDDFLDRIRFEVESYPVDMTLEGGERFWLSPDWYVEVIHTPGHTWGHLAVYDPRSKTMISSEAALWNAILDINWNPVMAPTYCYVDTYLSTLARLMAMDIETLSPAHWPLQQGSEVAEFLRESRNYCLFVEKKLLEFAQMGAFTMKSAIDALWQDLGQWDKSANGALPFPMNGNLARLVQRGQLISYRNDDGLVEWRLAE